jgi:O-antigen/teichoic acid export membrane protein
VLRTLDRFDLLSWGGVVDPILRVILTAGAWTMKAPFEAYVAIWFATDLLGDLYQWWLTWRELRRRGMTDALRPTLHPHSLKNAWRFAVRVNLASSLGAAWGPLARLIVGGLLGPASAGLYRVAATLSDSAQKPIDLLSRAFYPEVMKMDPRTKRPWKLMLRGAALAGIFAVAAILIVFFAGEQLIRLIFGKDFIGAYSALVVLIIAPLLAMVSFPMPPMLYALHRDQAPLISRIVGTVLYLLMVAPLTWRFGLAGAAAAFVIGTAVMVLVLAIQLLREYRVVRAG